MNDTSLSHHVIAQQLQTGYVLASACPSRQILQHLTNRWGGLVIVVLGRSTQPQRFSEIRKAIDGISERMLAQTLQQLEQDGMVHRQSFQTVPPHVEYHLTEFGRQAAERWLELVGWLEQNLPEILAHVHKNNHQ
ncbi:MAG: helix-turn-helix domain-containing protein [Acinetobacter sp.]|nr:helix-turn-helix domain-containing protein [Acinetobacter sp.]